MTTKMLMVAWLLMATLPVFALTIEPRIINCLNTGGGATSHKNVNCLFAACGDPKLIQCYLTISGDLLSELSVNMVLSKDAETVTSVPLSGYTKRGNSSVLVFNFEVHRDMLKESHIDIHSRQEYLRVEMGKIEIMADKVPENGGTKAAFANRCATQYVPHAQVFAFLHPEESQRYSLLASTSPEFIAYVDELHRDTMSAVIANLERKKNEPAKLVEYIAYLKRVQEGLDFRSKPEWVSITNRIRENDSLYLYDYKQLDGDANYSDNGLLILRDGDVVYRRPLGWSKSGTNELPTGKTIDRL